MKFRTSFCNGPVLRKDLTRFAPLWGCYSIFLLLMLTVLIGLRTEYIRCLNAADYVIAMGIVNLIYAFLAAQMLFGDLFNSRMCNALHALPLKRECWFGTHVTAALPPDPVLRWAGLLHDTGKIATFTLDDEGNGHFYGHAEAGAAIADTILRRLKAPNHLREQVCFLIEAHMTLLTPERKILRRRIARYGLENIRLLLRLQQADSGGKGTGEPDHFDPIEVALEAIRQEDACLSLRDLAINGHDLMALGYSGRTIGARLNRLLELVLDEQLTNERDALIHHLTTSELEEHP